MRLLEVGREGRGRRVRAAAAAAAEAVAYRSLMRCGRNGVFADDGYCGVRPFEYFFFQLWSALWVYE